MSKTKDKTDNKNTDIGDVNATGGTPNKEKVGIPPKTGTIRPIKLSENKKTRIGPVTHELNTDHKHFGPKWTGIKNFTILKNDRDFQVNDHIWFSEVKKLSKTGRRIWTRIMYILDDNKYLQKGFVGISLKILHKLSKNRPV